MNKESLLIKTARPSFLRLLMLGLLLFSFSSASAQSMQAVQQQVTAWLEQELQSFTGRYQISFPSGMPQIELAACNEALQIRPQSQQAELRGRVSLRVACPAPEWFIFVTADIQLFAQVLVAAAEIARGAQIPLSALILQEMNVSNVRGNYYTDPAALAGTQASVRIRGGDIITDRQAVINQTVNRGDQVMIRAAAGGLNIRMLGEALEQGRPGEYIRVRNLQSDKIIRARVSGQGEVVVDF